MPYPTQKDTINLEKNAAAFSRENKKKEEEEEFVLKGELSRADPVDSEYEPDWKETSWSAPEIQNKPRA